MLDCVINWRAMMSGEEQVAAAFERQRFSFPATITRGDNTANPRLLAQVVHGRQGPEGVSIRMTTDVLLSNGGLAFDLHGNTRIAVSQLAGKKRAHAWVKMECDLPDMAWKYEGHIPTRGVSRTMRKLEEKIDAVFAQLAEQRGKGSGEIARNLSTIDARRLLDVIASWAAATGMEWRAVT